MKLNDFFNDGFGWMCTHCFREFEADPDRSTNVPRLMTEGEAESKSPQLSNPALAKWADPAHRILTCPRCGISELADIS